MPELLAFTFCNKNNVTNYKLTAALSYGELYGAQCVQRDHHPASGPP